MDAEEQALEQEATEVRKEEEVRAKVIEEFGFDEVDDAERIEKMVAKEMASHKKLTTAIGQKIKYRTEAEAAKKTSPEPKPTEAKPDVDVTKVVNETLEERDLAAMDYPEEIKAEIKRIAQVQNISVRQAERDPYVTFKVDAWKKEQQAEEAAITRTNRSSGKKSFSVDTPPDVDMATEEGRKTWADYTAFLKQQGM